MKTLNKIFKIEIDFSSVMERSGFVIYSIGVIYCFLGFYVPAYQYQTKRFFYSETLIYDIGHFLYRPFLSCQGKVSWCEYVENRNGWNDWYLRADDAIIPALFVLSITFIIRYALTQKLNPLPWK
tara:strand:+ start:64 stop:438 length:375 start_codon:yes stop_codon:yes gene_type:complete